jgi:hypothetical protein
MLSPPIVTNWYSPWRGSNAWPRSYNRKSDTRAISAADSKNKLERMKTIVQTASVEGKATPLKEVVPFWFALSSPLLGALLGLLGAWFVTWLSA